MKQKNLIILLSALSILGIISCNSYFNKAMKDVKANKITSSTVSNLEIAKTKDKKKIDSFYQLARIYHYNSDFQDLDKAQENYQYLINHFYDNDLTPQYEKLKKKQSVEIYTFKIALGDVNDLIDTRTFNSYIKINTLAAYKEFVSKYPGSNHITDAKNKAFDKAVTINTLDVYKEFTVMFPGHKTTATYDRAFDKACADNTYPVYTDFIGKFPDYKDKAQNNAFEKAGKINTYQEYVTYLSFFPNYKKNEIYGSLFELVKKTNTIEAYQKYIVDFPSSQLINDAKAKIDYINVQNFLAMIADKPYSDKLISIDDFIYSNPNNTYNSSLTSKAKESLPKLNNIPDLQATYKQLRKVTYKTNSINDIVNHYFDEKVLKIYNDDNTSVNCFIKCMAQDSPNFEEFKNNLQKIITNYNTILSNYKLSQTKIDEIKSLKLNDEFALAAIPLIYGDYTTDDAHRKRAKAVRSLLNNTKYTNCSLYDALKKTFDQATHDIPCKTCNGSGKVPEKKCLNCKGRGLVKCTAQYKVDRNKQTGAWGSTTVDAVSKELYCKGGYIKYENYNVSHAIKIDEVCSTCNGSGQTDCPRCNGLGVIDECGTCGGSGHSTVSYLEYYK